MTLQHLREIIAGADRRGRGIAALCPRYDRSYDRGHNHYAHGDTLWTLFMHL